MVSRRSGWRCAFVQIQRHSYATLLLEAGVELRWTIYEGCSNKTLGLPTPEANLYKIKFQPQ